MSDRNEGPSVPSPGAGSESNIVRVTTTERFLQSSSVRRFDVPF